jgi:hypothetical protein
MTDYEKDTLSKIESLIHKGKLSNDFLIASLQLSVNYLNLQRVEIIAKETGKSNWWIRKSRKKDTIKICDYQLIINNL